MGVNIKKNHFFFKKKIIPKTRLNQKWKKLTLSRKKKRKRKEREREEQREEKNKTKEEEPTKSFVVLTSINTLTVSKSVSSFEILDASYNSSISFFFSVGSFLLLIFF